MEGKAKATHPHAQKSCRVIFNFREKIGSEVVWRAMSPLAILSILIVLVLPVPGGGFDPDGLIPVMVLLWRLLNFQMYIVYIYVTSIE